MSTLGTAHDLAYSSQLAVGFIFLVSAATKLKHAKSVVGNVHAYELVPEVAEPVVAWGLVGAELYVAFALLTGWTQWDARFLALAVLGIFSTVVILVLRQKRRVPCGCFGEQNEEVSSRTVARLGLLITAASFATVAPQTRTIADILAEDSTPAVGYLLKIASVATALILLSAWMLELPQLLRAVQRSLARPPARPL